MAVTNKNDAETVKVTPAAPEVKKEEAPAAKKTRAPRKTAEKKAAEKKPAEKKTAARKPRAAKAAKEELVFIEINQRQATPADLVDRAKADWTANGNKASELKSIRVYVNTNEGMVYYVVNDSSAGSFVF